MFPKTFSTARLLLRPIQADDAAAIFNSYGQDAEVTRFLTWRPHASIEETNSFVQACLNAETSQTYMMTLQVTGEVVGVFDLRTPSKTRVEFGYALARL